MRRHRSEQKGKSGSSRSTILRQVGQRRLRTFFGIGIILSPVGRRRKALASRLLKQSGDEVVVVGFGDLTAMEGAGLQFTFVGKIGNVYLAVDFRRMHGSAAFPEQFRIFGLAFDEQVELASDEELLLAAADRLLDLDQ